jgi:uncharacterized protein (DUF58 family)
MPIAAASSSYPLLNAFWTMFEFFLWVIWIWVLIMVFLDIFRSRDLSGVAKALWFVFVLVIPLFGVLAYLIARGSSMQDRTARWSGPRDGEPAAGAPAASPGAPASSTDQLVTLADLRDRGVISDGDFEREKARVLA